jgi:hypothetical protein
MITDERLKSRAECAIVLQAQGQFLLDFRRELPLPVIENLRYSHERDELGRYYDYESEWGRFNFASGDRSLLVLRKGTPPKEFLPQPKLQLATATIHTGYASIHNNGSSFELDFQTRDQYNWETLQLLNQTLAAEKIPIVVWQVEQAQDETPPIIRIANDSAMLFASSAIWDNDEGQLVAAQVVTTSQELLKAIKATLANNNSKSYLTLKAPDDNAYLKGARRGFITVSNNLANANAEGTVTALLHPLSGDPQTQTQDYFYVVGSTVEPISEKFCERLDLAIPWPLQGEWSDYLQEAGQEADLVEVLPSEGTDFSAGLRVRKNESAWAQVISEGPEGRPDQSILITAPQWSSSIQELRRSGAFFIFKKGSSKWLA